MKTETLPSEYKLPKSWCFCGHSGDGPHSDHAGINGHGACTIKGCDCIQFTWEGWTKDFQAKLDKDKAQELQSNVAECLAEAMYFLEYAARPGAKRDDIYVPEEQWQRWSRALEAAKTGDS